MAVKSFEDIKTETDVVLNDSVANESIEPSQINSIITDFLDSVRSYKAGNATSPNQKGIKYDGNYPEFWDNSTPNEMLATYKQIKDIISSLENIAGSGLTYNGVTKKLNLGGVIDEISQIKIDQINPISAFVLESDTNGANTNYKDFIFTNDALSSFFGLATSDISFDDLLNGGMPIYSNSVGITPSSDSSNLLYTDFSIDKRWGMSTNPSFTGLGMYQPSNTGAGLRAGIKFNHSDNSMEFTSHNSPTADPSSSTSLMHIRIQDDTFLFDMSNTDKQNSDKGGGYSSDITTEWNDSTSDSLFATKGYIDRKVMKADTTANRPISPIKGEQFLDETLGYPIVFNGTNWVNYIGAIV